jgi:toxin FitB
LELVTSEIRVVVLSEIRPGVERIRVRDQAQARVLERWLQRVSNDFPDSILLVDQRVADQWGRLVLRQPVPVLDAFMAAPALVHGLTVVSRDGDGFRNTGVQFVNPFSSA